MGGGGGGGKADTFWKMSHTPRNICGLEKKFLALPKIQFPSYGSEQKETIYDTY